MPCSLGLEGMRVLVTASTKGIGRGIVEVLGSCGARVVLNGRSREGVEEALRRLGGDVWGVEADLSVPGEAARLVEEASRLLGGLDALVYVPPPPPGGGFSDVGAEEWRLSYRLLVEAPVEAVRAALPRLRESRNGSVVFVTSVAAWEPIPDIVTSSVLRPGLHHLTVLLARELAPYGVRVNAVVPGYIETDRLRSIAERRARARGTSVEEEMMGFARSVPLGRLGTPRDMGWAVAFLLSPRSSYITGAILPVTGGLHRSPH